MGMAEEMKNLPKAQEFDDLQIEEQNITVEKLKEFLPKGSRVKVNQQTVDTINKLIDESACHRGLMEERLMSHLHLIGPGVGIKQVMNGVKFVTLATTPGMTQSKAYAMTFPDKAQEILERNGDISSFASQYAATKIPTTIMQDVQIGPSITYAPLRHQVVQKYIELMNGKGANDTVASPTVQLNASIALMEYIKVPEEMTINLNHDMSEDAKSVQQNLADQISKAVDVQMARLAGGEKLGDVQRVGIITEAEVIDE